MPGIDIDGVLSSPDSVKTTLAVPGSPVSATSRLLGNNQDAEPEPAIPEAVPSHADGFNWQEENVSVDGLTDGMAALSVEPTGVGYLGNIAHYG